MPVKNISTEDFIAMATTFKGLGDGTRLRILAALFEGEACVSDLETVTGISQSAVSHQLRLLRNLKFVSAKRVGQQVFYRIDDDHIGDLFERALEHARHLDHRS